MKVKELKELINKLDDNKEIIFNCSLDSYFSSYDGSRSEFVGYNLNMNINEKENMVIEDDNGEVFNYGDVINIDLDGVVMLYK